jgi:hypothetical protein
LEDNPNDFINDLKERNSKNNKSDKQITAKDEELTAKDENNIATENIDNRAIEDKKITIENISKLSSQNNFTKLSDSIKGLKTKDQNSKDKPYKKFVDSINALQETNFDETFDDQVKDILKDLESDETLFSLAFDLQKQDKQNNTNNFASFVESASKFEPSIATRLVSMEPKLKLAL